MGYTGVLVSSTLTLPVAVLQGCAGEQRGLHAEEVADHLNRHHCQHAVLQGVFMSLEGTSGFACIP